ncbi:MAG: FixH family protein [Pseudomonadota bacterium]
MTEQPRQSRWIPWVFVGMFAVIFAVNAVMLTFALKSFNGLSVDGAYDRGLGYNETLADYRDQRALGWKIGFQESQSGPLQSDISLSLLLADDQPVTVEEITAQARRPTSAGMDFEVSLRHAGRGLYEAQIDWPVAGQWDLRLVISAGEEAFRLDKRLMVR